MQKPVAYCEPGRSSEEDPSRGYANVMLEPLILDLDGVLRIWDRAIIIDAERENGLPAGSLATAAFEDPQRLHDAITGVVSRNSTSSSPHRHGPS